MPGLLWPVGHDPRNRRSRSRNHRRLPPQMHRSRSRNDRSRSSGIPTCAFALLVAVTRPDEHCESRQDSLKSSVLHHPWVQRVRVDTFQPAAISQIVPKFQNCQRLQFRWVADYPLGIAIPTLDVVAEGDPLVPHHDLDKSSDECVVQLSDNIR